MFRSPLEAKVAADPKSPYFARVASDFLQQGKVEEALKICTEGIKLYPRYATGHLVLGKCFEALGRSVEAMLEYRRALGVIPDNPTVRVLVREAEQREQGEFQEFAERKVQTLKERRGTLSLEGYVSHATPEGESAVDFLLRQLRNAKKTQLVETTERGGGRLQNDSEATAKIVTATLAEIYATQGEYKEAIDAYKRLVGQKPEEAARYEKRLAELEELARLQKLQEKQ